MFSFIKKTRVLLIWLCLTALAVQDMISASSWAATTDIAVFESTDRYPAGDTYPILIRVRIASPWYLHGTEEGPDGLIPTRLSFKESPALKIVDIRFPDPQKKKFPYTKEEVDVFTGEIMIRANVAVSKDATPGSRTIEGQLSFQACSSKLCLPPEKVPVRIPVLIARMGAHAEPKNEAMFASRAQTAPGSKPTPGWQLGAGLFLTLIGIFIGGLALNLTPCIYPLIPITVSYFGGRSGEISGRPVLHGVLYICGLAVTNSVLGVTASLTGGMLGSALQSPFVLSFVAAVLMALALSFFGFWELRLPSGLTRLASKNFGGQFGTFFMGLTLGIVAAPCLGPFVLGLLTYVGQQGDPFLGFLYFFVLSIGLGLPLSILAVFSGALDKLPVSGEWMVWVRKALGWVLVCMAGYMLQPLISSAIGRSALLGAPLLAAALHLGWLDRTRTGRRIFQYMKKGVALVFGISAFFSFALNIPSGPGVDWIAYDETILQEAVREGKPVIIDFYANWCGPCKAMETEVFTDPEVVKLSKDFVNVRVDLTRKNDRHDKIIEQYRIRGVPTIIFLNEQGIEERDFRIETYTNSRYFLKRMRSLTVNGRKRGRP